MKRLLIIFGMVGVLLGLWRKQAPREVMITGRAMGCDWKLVTDEKVDRDGLRVEIAAVLEHWEQVLSTWREDSDLSRYNRAEAATADLSRAMSIAQRLHRQTGGAFDHRMLGQLTDAGFGPGGTGVDLSSIGKGFGVERVCEMLEDRGIRRYVFSLAGEVKAGEGNWPVAIESPDRTVQPPPECLSGQAMATSGNYRQWNRSEEGKLASHILNPATGHPVVRPPCSVTVIGPDAAEASGWATALFVLGPVESHRAELLGMRVVWRGRTD